MKSNYAISAGNPITLAAAEQILQAGGNAVDAAIAAYLSCFVAEPCMASAGAGGFAMIADGSATQCVDFFCQTPLQKRPAGELDFFPVTIDFGTATEDFHVGRGSVATPGAIAGIYFMHKHWATIPMPELATHAIQTAKEGAAIDAFQAYDIQLLSEIFLLSEAGRALVSTNNRLKGEGDRLYMHEFADFLEVLAIEGPDLFYKGEVAKTIVADQQAQGGNLTYEDFERYQAVPRQPITIPWAEHTVQTTGSPSVGGALIAAYLHEYTNNIAQVPAHSSREHLQRLIHSYDQVNAIKDDDRLIAKYMKETFGIDMQRGNTTAKWNGTSHFNIVDRDGMAVALTTSVGEGCGYFIPGTNMQLNNMLGEAALLPQGFHSWSPNTRLRSMMTPTVVRDKAGTLKMVTGSGGAGRIPFAIAQTIINHILYKQPIHDAVNNSRIHKHDDITNVEPNYEVGPGLHTKRWAQQSLYFGGVHSISRDGAVVRAAGDLRRHGVAKVGS